LPITIASSPLREIVKDRKKVIEPRVMLGFIFKKDLFFSLAGKEGVCTSSKKRRIFCFGCCGKKGKLSRQHHRFLADVSNRCNRITGEPNNEKREKERE
jgi:hypothetical protein